MESSGQVDRCWLKDGSQPDETVKEEEEAQGKERAHEFYSVLYGNTGLGLFEFQATMPFFDLQLITFILQLTVNL